MIKIVDMNVTIKTDSLADTFIEGALVLHSVRDIFLDAFEDEDKADRLFADMGRLAVLDEDTMCETLAELIKLLKGKEHDS